MYLLPQRALQGFVDPSDNLGECQGPTDLVLLLVRRIQGLLQDGVPEGFREVGTQFSQRRDAALGPVNGPTSG